MTQQEHDTIRELLKKVIPPVGEAALQRDLWPEMLGRLDRRAVQASRLDWALLALVMIWLLLFPQTIPGLLYQL